jgi:hypothetical protein
MQWRFWFRLLLVSCAVLPQFHVSGAGLSVHATERFSGAGNCAFCHDQWGGALVDSAGNSLSITEEWRGTMMAHSFRDPFWRATMEAEVLENPRLKRFVETKCLTCHAPMARVHEREAGREHIGLGRANRLGLAGEGVGCTLCHQIQPVNLGLESSFTGSFIIGQAREIFGPYANPVAMPMRRHVNFTPVYGRHVQDSAFCGSCHTLFTPVLSKDGAVLGEFPEQTPFLEWQASVYARENQHCQDCHMQRVDEPVKISARPPWLGTREPFWRHQFVGGNVFMLRLLSANGVRLKANAGPDQFRAIQERTIAQLRSAAKLSVAARREGGLCILTVDVENLSGHKFPAGHPYRRAWLHVRVTGQGGGAVFESGGFDEAGRIIGQAGAYQEHHTEITDPAQAQVYQAIMGDAAGVPTFSLLRAASYIKDNRLPPKGFEPTDLQERVVGLRGNARQDPDLNDGSGRDRVTYRFSAGGMEPRLKVEVQLLYQAVPPEAVARLVGSKAPEAKVFTRLYHGSDRTPERVAEATLEF